MKFISNLKIKNKLGPIILGGLTLAVLLVALMLSTTYSGEVLAQVKSGASGSAGVNSSTTGGVKSPTGVNSAASGAAGVTKAAPSNQNASTSETIDDSGEKGFVICGNTVDTPCNVSHLFRAFIIIINYLITMAGLVAILFIVIAGVQMTMSRGEEWLRQAKQRMTGAVFGLVLVALAFVLINSLLAGSLNLGIKQGGQILSDPKGYINQ